MGLFLSNMIIYIYNSLYAQTGLYNTLTMYSGAIMGTLQDGGTLHTVYLTIRSVGYGVLVMYFVIAMGTKLSSRTTSPNVIVQTLIQFLVGVAFTTMSFICNYYTGNQNLCKCGIISDCNSKLF